MADKELNPVIPGQLISFQPADKLKEGGGVGGGMGVEVAVGVKVFVGNVCILKAKEQFLVSVCQSLLYLIVVVIVTSSPTILFVLTRAAGLASLEFNVQEKTFATEL